MFLNNLGSSLTMHIIDNSFVDERYLLTWKANLQPLGPCCCNKILLFWLNMCYRIKVNLIFLSFFIFLSSSWASMFVCEILIFSTWHMAMKNTRITRILCLCLSMVVWLLGVDLKKEAKMKKIYTKKERMKACEELKPWSLLSETLMALHMSSSTSKQVYFISNLGPNNEPRNVQFSHYWPQDFWALTPSVT